LLKAVKSIICHLRQKLFWAYFAIRTVSIFVWT